MTTIKNIQKTYFTNDSKHRRSTYMVGNQFSSHIQFVRYNILIAQNRKLLEDSGLMSKAQLDTICNRKETLKQLSSGDIFHGKKAVKSDTNRTNPNIGTIHSGFSDDPLEASEISDDYSRRLKLILNMFYKLFSREERCHLYPYFITISKKNCSAGQLLPELRGTEAKGSHLTDNFRKNVKAVLEYIRYYYPIVGGVSKTEVTMNKISLLEEISKGLFHDHQHILLISKSPIGVHKLRHGNYFNHFIFDKIKDVFGPGNVDKLAFDCRPISVRNGNLGNAVIEISKYASKPQLYQSLKYVSEKDVKENIFDEFHLKAFAELRGAMYNLHLKDKFGLFDKIDKMISRLGRIKPAIKSALANNPDFNVSGRRTFGKVLTQEGLCVWANGSKEQGHWKLIHFNAMNDKTFLYSNRQLISKSLLSSQQLGWVRTALHTFNSSELGVKKDSAFNRVANYVNDLPFLHSVNDLVSWISSVADGKMKQAKKYLYQSKSFTDDAFHTYQMKKNDVNDLYRLVNCIKKYSDERGVIRLNLHTNPDYKYKVFKWVQTYKGAVSYLGGSVSQGWKFYGALHNGRKDIENRFSSSDQSTYRVAMKIADSSLDYMEMTPKPREMVDLDSVGFFVKCDVQHFKDGNTSDEDTGELIDENHYGMLTAPKEDVACWSEDGTGFDIDLFANITKFKDIEFDVHDALTVFTESKLRKSSGTQAKKMANLSLQS